MTQTSVATSAIEINIVIMSYEFVKNVEIQSMIDPQGITVVIHHEHCSQMEFALELELLSWTSATRWTFESEFKATLRNSARGCILMVEEFFNVTTLGSTMKTLAGKL